MFSSVQRYIRLGWPVLPLTGKIPKVANGSKDATLDEAIAAEWWQRWPDANIGIATGHRFFAFDVDVKNGGEESYDLLRNQHGAFPVTHEQITGTGGHHFLFQVPDDFVVRNSTGKLAPGIDIRGYGGYIVAAPSIHPETLQAYEWDGMAEIEDTPLAVAPAWLLTWLRHNSNGTVRTANTELAIKIPKGTRHATLVSIAGSMRRCGLLATEIFATLWSANLTRCEPPYDEPHIRQIADSMERYSPDPRADLFRNAAGSCQDNKRTSDGATVTEPLRIAAPDMSDILARVEVLVAEAVASKDIGKVFNDPELIVALAQSGSVKQYESRRRLKAAFGADLPLREFDARLKAATLAAMPVAETTSPYILTSQGGILPNVANAITMMQALPLRFSAFSYRPFLTDLSPWGTIGPWTDHDDAKAAEWCQHQDLNIDIRTAAAAAEAVARSREHFYPVREYLKSLVWDEAPRIGTWLHDYLGVKASSYSSEVGRKWLISAVKRAFEPGCQADYVIIFEGFQGKRKSTALRILARDWFTDDITDIGSKDSAIQLQGKWIVELAELDAFRRPEMTAIKAFLVRRTDHYRPPYGRRAEDFPRMNVFAGTTNKSDWLQDDTGGRRFWPVTIGEIDIDGLAADCDQIWAEAVFYYLEGELSYLTENTENIAAQEQHDRQETDVWKSVVEDWVRNPSGSVLMRSTSDRIYLEDIMQHCLSIPQKDWNNVQKNRITRILKLAKYESKRALRSEAEADGKRLEYWTKNNADDAAGSLDANWPVTP